MYRYKNAKFITSAAAKKGWIEDEMPEICFIGKSNVGKSTLLNALTNQKKLAKTSQQPGKTRLLNFFEINNGELRFVDAPGYGYASINNEMKDSFKVMMDEYINGRDNLKLICLLIDMRHTPTKDDVQMYEYLKYYKLPVLLIGTKLDKLKKNDIKKNAKIIQEKLKLHKEDDFIQTSSSKKTNIENLWNILGEKLNLT